MKISRVIDAKGRTVLTSMRADGKLLRIDGDLFTDSMEVTDEVIEAKRWLCPVEAGTIYCIGLNYAKHAAELRGAIPEFPVVFMKNPSAAIGHLEDIRIPKVCDDEMDYEGELVVVIGKKCCNAAKAEALGYVLGYMCGNDVSARIWQMQKGGSQWCHGKGFDTFAPIGPMLVTAEDIPDPNVLDIKTELNGRIVQQSNTNDMIFDVQTLINFLSQDTTLLPGTVIMTGTPGGVGWTRNPKLTLKTGDRISVEIEKIGRLDNNIK